MSSESKKANAYTDANGNHRVVITGAGVISPVGNDVKSFWDAVVNGRHGIRVIDKDRFPGTKVSLAAEIKDFEPLDYVDRKEVRRMDRYCLYAVVAAKEAVESSGIDFASMDPFDVGVIIGSGVGGLHTMQNQYEELLLKGGAERISPLFIPMMISNIAAGKISMVYGLKGANFCVTTACASGTHAIGEAFRQIKHGYLKAAIAGGTEAPITPIALAGFSNMKALNMTEDPDRGSMPFDMDRGGFVIAEGAGLMVMETMENAVARGANIMAEIAGYGSTADAYHITSPDPEGKGAAQAMRHAMQEANIAPENVSYINAHGTGTDLNDKYETLAIKAAFGDAAYKVAISSTKSVTGHLLGAAGGVEAIASILAIRDSIIPPTIGLATPDPECDLDYTPKQARKAVVTVAVSNSLGFGGQNGSLLFKKVEE
jgi:3-oxoacyl-[acyl-carrier-protein] synthase II